MRGAQRRRERFLDQHVKSRLQRDPRHGHVAGQRRRVQDRLRPRCRDRFLQRFEAHLGRRAQLLPDDVQRVGIGVHVADELDLGDLREDPPGPVPSVRAEPNLEDPKRAHGRQ